MIGATMFSGIMAPEAALPHWDWKWCAEIEPFPCSVIKAHHPEVANLGDVTADDFSERASQFGPLDVLVAGWPCQDLSVAGLRAGLAGERSGLFFRLLHVLETVRPAWVLLENVPGLLSSNDGDDFTSVLDSLEGLGYVIDVDILDAQYFGLAQRRRRVFFACQHIDSLLKQKTTFSGLTIAQCLCEICALILAGAETPSNTASLASDFDVTKLLDSLRRRIKLFGMDKPGQVSILADNLAAIQMSSDCEQDASEFPHGSEPDTKTPMDTRSPLSEGTAASTDEYRNIAPSLKSLLDESLQIANEFITSTSKSEITESKIYTCSQLMLNITHLIGQSDPSCPSFWSAESSASTALKEFINYARSASSSLFTEVEWIQPWSDFITEALRAEKALRDARDWADSLEVLPLSKGMCGDSEESREAGKDIAPTTSARTEGGRGLGTDFDCDGGLVMPTLDGRAGRSGANSFAKSGGLVAFGGNNTSGAIDTATAVNAKGGSGRMDFESETFVTHSLRGNETAGSLKVGGGKPGQGYPAIASYGTQMAVRRLTPTECERLQGFDDGWTAVTHRGKEAADGPRYKAIGNSMARTVLAWLGHRIEQFMAGAAAA